MQAQKSQIEALFDNSELSTVGVLVRLATSTSL